MAQDSPDPEPADQEPSIIEEVIVTGTRIKRRDFDSPSPLVTVPREDFEFSGQPMLDDYLNTLPQLQPFNGRTTNNGSDGTTALDLRGLGPGRTLVLLNGRRIAPSGTGSAVDVNNLPSILIDRVEIITGGASTVYGSDAIAGVINFITRSHLSGLSVEGSYSVTAKGDSDIWDANAVYGWDLSNDGNITFYGGRYEREELYADMRDISSQLFYDDWESGELKPGGSSTIPSGVVFKPQIDLGTGPGPVTWTRDGTPRPAVFPKDLYNYQPFNYLQTPLTRDTLGVLGTLPLAGRWESYFEASYARNKSESSLAPAPFDGYVAVNTDNPVLTAATRALFSREDFVVEDESGLAFMTLARRLAEFGPRIIEHDHRYARFLAGIRGEFGSGWSLDAWLTYTDANEKQKYYNTGSNSRIQQGLLVDPATGQCFDTSGGCVPVDLFGEGNLSQEAQDFIRIDGVGTTTSRTQSLASIVVTGAPFEIWSGPVDMSFGLEWRSDNTRYRADDLLVTGDAIGLNADASIDGTESVYEFYSEALLSLWQSRTSGRRLQLEVGGRWSRYDRAGSVTTWKAGLNWQATDSLRFRTMMQHAVRAPNNEELFRAQLRYLASNFVTDTRPDPCSASSNPVNEGNADKCIAQGLPASQIGVFEATPYYPVEYTSGGNLDLVPESSDTFTAGLVFSPKAVAGLTLSVDYYDLQVEDTIGDVSPRVVCFDPLNTAGVFCDKIQRDETGNVSAINALIQNRGLLATNGVDAQIQFLTELPSMLSIFGDTAHLSVNATLNHVFSLEFQQNTVSTGLNCTGKFGWPCAYALSNGVGTFPRNRMSTNLNYRIGPLTVHLTWQWIGSVDNASPLGAEAIYGFSDPVAAIPRIGSWNYLDLGFAYWWDNGLLLRAGVNNLTDKDPPFMGDQNENNTDALMYDVFGRTYFVNLRYEFDFRAGQ
ncbi:MAG: TonB-dependent receptor [Lysobacterales bacterium]